MSSSAFDLHLARIPAWEAEDARAGMLGTISGDPVDIERVESFLDGVRFDLPAGIVTSDLVAFAKAQSTPSGRSSLLTWSGTRTPWPRSR